MNINLMMQALGGDISQLGQVASQGENGQDGEEFEDMLLQQSKASQTQRQEERPKDKTSEKSGEKQDVKKPQEKSTKEQETAKDGYEVAVALVTSQPVVPLTVFNTVEVQYTEDGAVVLDPSVIENVPQVQQAEDFGAMNDGYMEAALGQQEQPQEITVNEQALPQAVEAEDAPAAVELQVQDQSKAAETQPQTAQVDEGDFREASELPVEQVQAGSEADDDSDVLDVEVEARPVFRRDTMPTKVAENYETLAPEEKDAPQQLAGVIDQALNAGTNTVLMELSPANLGQLTIQLSRNAMGELSIIMIPQTDKAANILNQHGSALMSALMDRGEQAVTVEVRMPEEAQNANMFLNPDGHNQQQEQDERKEQKSRRRTEGVNSVDFLQQLRLGLVGLEQAE